MNKTLKSFESRIDNYFDGSPLVSNHIATSHSQARYRFWREHSEVLRDYKHCMSFIKAKSLGAINKKHFFKDVDKFNRVCEKRGIPFAKQGMSIDIDGLKGFIVGADDSMNLEVMIEDAMYIAHCHPTWETTYYDDSGNVIASYKKQEADSL